MPEGEISRGKALFRLPAETAYHRIEGTATAGGDGASLPAGGFFIVPFAETADAPAVRIEEERHEVLPIDFEANAPLPDAAPDAETGGGHRRDASCHQEGRAQREVPLRQR